MPADEVGTASDAVSQRPGFLVARVHRRFRDALVAALDGSGLNPGHVAILGALSATNGLSQSELTAVTGIEKSSMVLMVDALEAAKWVRRRPHASDRRAHAIAMTGTGRRKLAAIGPKLQAAEDTVTASLTPAQRRVFVALLRRFVD